MKIQYKIFIAMLITNIFLLLMMGYVDYYRASHIFKNEKIKDIDRIESRVQESFNYILQHQKTENISLEDLFHDRIFELSSIFNTRINLYDLEGRLLVSNYLQDDILPKEILEKLTSNESFDESENLKKNDMLYNKYSYIIKNNNKIAILNVQGIINTDAVRMQNYTLLKYYLFIIIFMSVIGGMIAWVVSHNLMNKISSVARRFTKVNMMEVNQHIDYNSKDEMKIIVDSYNRMIDQLEHQNYLLQKQQKEADWRMFARQVAHEINNPLTPLKLNIQNFQRKYRADDVNNEEKVRKLTETVVHYVDMISVIANSFSNYAKLPEKQGEEIDVVEVIKQTVEVFTHNVVNFHSDFECLTFKMDRTHFTRVIHNIVKNGLQSNYSRYKKVDINLLDKGEKFIIAIKDNGIGISEEDKQKIFQENFTTKSSGNGLGLMMVKNIVEDYNGSIWFESEKDKGTTFFIEFNKI